MATFPRVQSLRGELKRTEIRGSTRYQLTTREIIVQRPQRTYRIALENILGFIECADEEYRAHAHRLGGSERAVGQPYKIVATVLYLVSPSGVIEQTKVSFYTRLSVSFARQLEALLESTRSSSQGA